MEHQELIGTEIAEPEVQDSASGSNPFSKSLLAFRATLLAGALGAMALPVWHASADSSPCPEIPGLAELVRSGANVTIICNAPTSKSTSISNPRIRIVIGDATSVNENRGDNSGDNSQDNGNGNHNFNGNGNR